jgi:hypothetical protein
MASAIILVSAYVEVGEKYTLYTHRHRSHKSIQAKASIYLVKPYLNDLVEPGSQTGAMLVSIFINMQSVSPHTGGGGRKGGTVGYGDAPSDVVDSTGRIRTRKSLSFCTLLLDPQPHKKLKTR